MEVEVVQNISYDDLLDAVEVQMQQNGLVDIEIIHAFTPGIYTRSIVNVPANTYLLSHIHNSEHQFIMSKGLIIIYTADEGMKLISAPYLGKTMPGTRRLAKTESEVTWTSIHATSVFPADNSKEAFDAAVKAVEAELYAKHENIFLIKMEDQLLCQQ